MSRLTFRPRPLDIHKKLPILTSVKEFEDDEVGAALASTRNSHVFRLAAEAVTEVRPNFSKSKTHEIPTPKYKVVDTYERDYLRTFAQPTSYLRGRGARAEIGEFVEYDLDNEDENWLQGFNREKRLLAPEKFEAILFKLEVLDHRARERTGSAAPTFSVSVPVILEQDAAAEALQGQSIRYGVFQSVYNYWKTKRERWQKPILRRLQPPPPVNDTNPYNVFRPREKAHRLHTRRMQRRENNVQSFEKLRQVRHNLSQAKTVLKSLIKREEKKREVMENEVSLQRIQIKYKDEAQLVEDGVVFPGFPSDSCRYEFSDDDFLDSDDTSNGRPSSQSTKKWHSPYMGSRLIVVPAGRMKRELKQRPHSHGWLQMKDPSEPVLLFTRPLDSERLAAAGITQPQYPSNDNGLVAPHCHFHGRIGRGGRIIFDRWDPFRQAQISHESSQPGPPNRMPPQPNG